MFTYFADPTGSSFLLPPALFHPKDCPAGEELLLIWNWLYLTLIFEDYCHWLLDSGFTDFFFFKHFEEAVLFLLAVIVPDKRVHCFQRRPAIRYAPFCSFLFSEFWLWYSPEPLKTPAWVYWNAQACDRASHQKLLAVICSSSISASWDLSSHVSWIQPACPKPLLILKILFSLFLQWMTSRIAGSSSPCFQPAVSPKQELSNFRYSGFEL